ncbi:hypothetical protein BH24GEM1_BH24GEM1_31800 [soil metagenome]
MRCSAKSKRSGEPCRSPAVTGRATCRMHGGTAPRGVASHSWRHGRYSKAVPARLLASYQDALGDPDLVALRDELALTDARMQEVLRALPADLSPIDRDAWTELLLPLLETRRRLADTERRRLEVLNAYVSQGQLMALVGALQQAVLELVPDRAVRAALGRRVEVLMNQPDTADAD